MLSSERQRLTRIRANLERRALIYEFTRAFFRQQGFLEVETPVRMPEIAPEQHIKPFESEGWFLSTSPELHMKRLLAAGYDKLFQFSHSFRKGERGRWHNPEFTLLEWYHAGASYLDMLADTEKLVTALAGRLGLDSVIHYQGQTIDLSLPWRRLTVREIFRSAAGWDPMSEADPLRFDTDLVNKVVPAFAGQPTLLLEYPAAMASLSRLKPGEPGVAERGEVFIGGLEIANAFSELRDAREQEKRFREEIEHIQKTQGRKAAMPRKFLEALRYLPECGGIALGVDRLVMLLCDAASIDEVTAFPVDLV
ncbi:MAG: EF-P lysine aminoacylase GenX [Chloroflexi bacterium]|nr:EF-P lysine aminoacylase GenX [Chloroflexota bacterium]